MASEIDIGVETLSPGPSSLSPSFWSSLGRAEEKDALFLWPKPVWGEELTLIIVIIVRLCGNIPFTVLRERGRNIF